LKEIDDHIAEDNKDEQAVLIRTRQTDEKEQDTVDQIEKGKDIGKKDFRVRIRRILFCLIDLTALHPRLDFS